MEKSTKNWKIYLQILFIVILFYVLYTIGLPLYFMFFMGLLILILVLFKGKLYKGLDDYLNKKFPFLAKLNPWTKKLIIIIIFFLIYILLKQIIFFILAQFGIDVQQMISESVNNSINNG